jgi:hypothetical protein
MPNEDRRRPVNEVADQLGAPVDVVCRWTRIVCEPAQPSGAAGESAVIGTDQLLALIARGESLTISAIGAYRRPYRRSRTV